MKMRLNRFLILILTVFALMNFYIAPKSMVAYNTKNLTSMNIIAKNQLVKSVNAN